MSLQCQCVRERHVVGDRDEDDDDGVRDHADDVQCRIDVIRLSNSPQPSPVISNIRY